MWKEQQKWSLFGINLVTGTTKSVINPHHIRETNTERVNSPHKIVRKNNQIAISHHDISARNNQKCH